MIIKLKNKLIAINLITKLVILGIIAFILPRFISNILTFNTDKQLLVLKGNTLEIIDSLGIYHFLNKEHPEKGYGSYGMFKDDYISIYQVAKATQKNRFEFAEVEIGKEIKTYRVLTYSFEVNEQAFAMEIGKSIASIYETEFIIRRYAFIVLVFVILATIITDILAFNRIMEPLYQLIGKLKLFDKPENFQYEKSKTTTYDFIYLENTIHQLLQKIQVLFNQEREFTGNVSHELLTPISIIKSKLDNLLLHSEMDDSDAIKIIELKKTILRLTRIVKTLLMMSRIENEEYLLNDTIHLPKLCKELKEELADRFEAKNINIIDQISEKDLFIKGNKDLIYTMIFNILSNAVKYTHEGGRVEFSLLADKKIIQIKDNGKGIEKEKLSNIFDRYKTFSKDSNSFGLGLALVKKICNYHQINIEIRSEKDQGTFVELQF